MIRYTARIHSDRGMISTTYPPLFGKRTAAEYGGRTVIGGKRTAVVMPAYDASAAGAEIVVMVHPDYQ